METVLPTADLAALNAANFTAIFHRFGQKTAAQRLDFPHGYTIITGEPHPLGNFALLKSGVSPAEAREAAGALRDSGYPSAIFHDSEAFDTPVHDELETAGFQRHDPLPMMAIDLASLAPPEPEDGITVKEIPPEHTDLWSDALAIGYDLPHSLARRCADLQDAFPGQIRLYGAFEQDEVRSTSMLFIDRGVAGIYCVATHPEARGKGLGALVTAEPLLAARSEGIQTAILQSSELGYSVYRRLGFEECGKIAFYVRIPEAV